MVRLYNLILLRDFFIEGRHDTLTNATLQWNKSKVKGMGAALAKRYQHVSIVNKHSLSKRKM